MKLNTESLKNKQDWQNAGVKTPLYNRAELSANTSQNPIWLHFGAGNIFRGYIAGIADDLINSGIINSGIIAAETFDTEIIDKIYEPYNNLVLNAALKPNGEAELSVYGSVTEAVKAGDGMNAERLKQIAASKTLQLISFTVTEKGYALSGADGKYLPEFKADIESGPSCCTHIMAVVTSLLYERFCQGGFALALVSMDNCSENGDKLKQSVLTTAREWAKRGFVKDVFIKWLLSEQVAFPWSMIDKITPSPAESIAKLLKDKNIEGMTGIVTKKKTFIAPFVNAEAVGYLVIENCFPNGCPPLKKSGVFLTDRETVKKAERMKVTSCLNPLHSAMAPFGCLLKFNLISEEMKDADISELVKRIGYTEGLPVAGDPGIISAKAFLDEVVNERLVNPFLPDSPQRIVVDHSQKVGIRFGETIKAYQKNGSGLEWLVAIPLAIAGWFRYLLAVDDEGDPFTPSCDPLLSELTNTLSGIIWNKPESYAGQLNEILKNEIIFGQDLTKTPLARKIECMFKQMLSGKGAVRKTLHNELYG